jgi:hypothetical protein
MMKVTIDTNIVRDYLDDTRPGHTVTVELFRLDEQNACELRVVSRIKADVPGGPLREQLERLEIFKRPMIPTIGEWELSGWDEDIWPTEEQSKECDAMLRLVFPGSDPAHPKQSSRRKDIGHLLGHKLAKRDIFVSNDKAFTGQAVALLRNHSVEVMTSAGQEPVPEYLNSWEPRHHRRLLILQAPRFFDRDDLRKQSW